MLAWFSIPLIGLSFTVAIPPKCVSGLSFRRLENTVNSSKVAPGAKVSPATPVNTFSSLALLTILTVSFPNKLRRSSSLRNFSIADAVVIPGFHLLLAATRSSVKLLDLIALAIVSICSAASSAVLLELVDRAVFKGIPSLPIKTIKLVASGLIRGPPALYPKTS